MPEICRRSRSAASGRQVVLVDLDSAHGTCLGDGTRLTPNDTMVLEMEEPFKLGASSRRCLVRKGPVQTTFPQGACTAAAHVLLRVSVWAEHRTGTAAAANLAQRREGRRSEAGTDVLNSAPW